MSRYFRNGFSAFMVAQGVLVVLLAGSAGAADLSSTVAGLHVPNAHLVAQDAGKVYRGAAPIGKAAELAAIGVTDVVIFKNDLHGEVANEVKELRDAGIQASRIHEIPFHWKDFPSMKTACAQTVEGLKILLTAYKTSGRAAFFHCTVGEDRTGALAGLFRMVAQGWTLKKAFKDEMCKYGYEAGNPHKPGQVVAAIRKELTPLFLKMAELVENGDLTADHLSDSVCTESVESSHDAAQFKCKAGP